MGPIAALGVECPRRSLASLVSVFSGEPLTLFAPTEGLRAIGFGITAEFALPRHDAAAVHSWAQQIFSRIERSGEVAMGFTPCVFGGASFSVESVRAVPWSSFGAMRFRLPRWLYVLDGEQARLLWFGEDSGRRAAQTKLDRVRLGLARKAPARAEHGALRGLRTVQLARPRWDSLATEALSTLRAGDLEKVVIARTAELHAPRIFAPRNVVARLEQARGSTAFGLSQGSWLFAGATPERLVRKTGRTLETEALAGTSPSAGALTALRRSAKDLLEHRLVVDEIARRLGPLCTSVVFAPRPELRRLADVTHLLTPLWGQLKAKPALLEIALHLHPTPAVGGLPKAQAVTWIDAHEGTARGWYAGFFGRLDAEGDGELSVSIRCGLVHGRRARVYSGAGIVATSDPAAEYAETALKQRPFLRALGALA